MEPVIIDVGHWAELSDGAQTEALRCGDIRRGVFDKDNRQLLREMRSTDELSILGADIVDGAYGPGSALGRLEFAQAMVRRGLRVSILSFSISEDMHPSVQRRLCRLNGVNLTVRDPYSLDRLHNIGVDARLVPDIAFAFQKKKVSAAGSRTLEWVRKVREAGLTPVALNVNRTTASLTGGVSRLYEKVAQLFSETSNWGIAWVLLPHDTKGDWSDYRVLAGVLEGPRAPAIHLADDALNATDIREICGSVSACITGRKHLLLAAYCEGTPSLGLDYLGKFQGLYNLVGVDGSPIDVGVGDWPARAAHSLAVLLSHGESERTRLKSRSAQLGAAAAGHFDRTHWE